MQEALNMDENALLLSGLTFHHLGFLTADVGRTVGALAAFGYKVTPEVTDVLQKADLCMAIRAGFPDIEIIKPHDDNEGLRRLLGRMGDHMYHICCETTDLRGDLRRIADKEIIIHELSAPKPAMLFKQRHVSFYLIEGLGVVEFLEL